MTHFESLLKRPILLVIVRLIILGLLGVLFLVIRLGRELGLVLGSVLRLVEVFVEIVEVKIVR